MAQFKPKQEAAPEPKAADPYEGLPAHVKPAVDAAGGLDSDAGKSVYVALSGRLLATPPAVQQEITATAKRRGRPAKATESAAVPTQAPTAPQPTAPAASFANAAPAPGDLEALLRNAMQTPTA